MIWGKEEEWLRAENVNLLTRMETLQTELKTVKNALANATEKLGDVPTTFPVTHFAVDFAKLNAFSIERVCVNGIYETVIGYMLDSKVNQWHLACDDVAHQELVTQMRDTYM